MNIRWENPTPASQDGDVLRRVKSFVGFKVGVLCGDGRTDPVREVVEEHAFADGRPCPCRARNVVGPSEVASLTHAQAALHGNLETRLWAVLDAAQYGALVAMAREYLREREGLRYGHLADSTVLTCAFKEAMRI